MDKRVTIKDIAEIMGVSTTTVYKALNNKAKISEELRERILRTAEELNYRPNRFAQALVRESIKIGVIIPSHPSTFFDYIEEGAHHAFSQLQDYNVQGEVIRTKDDAQSQEIWKYFFSNNFSGVLSCFNDDNHGCYELQKEYDGINMPIVAEVAGPLDNTSIVGAVMTPGSLLGSMAGQLMSLMVDNSKRVVVCAPDFETDIHSQACESFEKACREKSIKSVSRIKMDFGKEEEKKVSEFILSEYDDLGGVYIASNNSVTFCEEVQKAGLKERIKIIGQDLYPELVSCIKNGTLDATFYQNQYGNTIRAIKGLVNYIYGAETDFESVYYRAQVIMKNNIDYYEGLY